MGFTTTSAAEIGRRSGAESGLIEISGNTIFYEVAGKGPPVVFLHDGLVHREGFNHQWTTFSGRFTLLRYDRPGYGRSKPPEIPYSHVVMLKELLDFAGLDEVILIGGSAGGRLAIDFAIAHPRRVRAMILVGAAITGFPFSDHMWNRGWRKVWGDTPQEMLDFWANDPWFVAEENTAARALLRQFLTDNPQNLQNFPVDVIQPDPALPNLDKIKVPTMVMIGEADIADNHAQAGILETQIEGAERVIVLHCGHVPYMEQPEKFDQLVFEFFDKHGIGKSAQQRIS